MDVKEYKKYHEEHMMHNTGTSVAECAIIISSIPFCVFLSSYLTPQFRKVFGYVFDFVVIILPVLLNCTILSDLSHLVLLNLVLLSTTLIILKVDSNNFKVQLNKDYNGKKAFVSNYRASTNFISAICILAVDFTVFPKRLAKTETFGFGFMDLGVGCYICSNGFVEKNSPHKGQFTKLLKTELTLCALGLLRVLSVKSIEYHEHVSEYGVHWNFFFTLAVCRLLSYCIIVLTNNANPLYLSIAIGLLHQGFLQLGLQQWVFGNVTRDSFVSANREGLVSCLGYISLFFAASACGKYFTESKTYKNLFIRLVLISGISWVGTAVSLNIFSVSRRLCNIGYIFWIIALSVTELALFLILEVCLLSMRGRKVLFLEPAILKSINSYGLLFFIFSNILTGLVNLIFQTLLLGKMMSMLILISYMIILCSVTCIIDQKNQFKK